jgi:hypothetical protein
MLHRFLLFHTVTPVGQLCARHTVIRQDCVDRVGHRGDEGAQEVGGNPARGLLVQLGKGKLAGTIDGHEEIQAAFFRLHFGYVDMDITKRIFLKLLLVGLSPSTSGRCLMPWRWTQRCNEERVKPGMLLCRAYSQSSRGSRVCRRNATHIASCSGVSTVERAGFGPIGASCTKVRFFHFAAVFGLMA